MRYVIVEGRPWCKNLTKNLKTKLNHEFFVIRDKKDLNIKYINEINPRFIFFAHWSNIIPKSIHEDFECVIFHMTDLPYGRGGSPLQNLIVRGHKKTMLSAIKCSTIIDAGPIYLKKPLSLNGAAKEIYARASNLTEQMIDYIIINEPNPKPQIGEVVSFKRRKKEDGNINQCKNLDEFYNYIRMLDAEGYPRSFLNFGNFLIKFADADLNSDILTATVEISQKK